MPKHYEADPGPDGPVVKHGKNWIRVKGFLHPLSEFAEGTMSGGAGTVEKLREQGGVLSETLKTMKKGK